MSTKVSLFKANNGQDPCIGFEMRKKRKFERIEESVTRMKVMHKKTEAVLKKSQKKMRKYIDKKRSEPEEYKVKNQILLSTKDLKFQMKKQHLEKCFMRSYKIKKIISTNAIELEVLGSVKIHPVVDVSRVQMYKDQVENQKKECPLLVIIEEEEYKVEKILNKRKFREKDRYLV